MDIIFKKLQKVKYKSNVEDFINDYIVEGEVLTIEYRVNINHDLYNSYPKVWYRVKENKFLIPQDNLIPFKTKVRKL